MNFYSKHIDFIHANFMILGQFQASAPDPEPAPAPVPGTHIKKLEIEKFQYDVHVIICYYIAFALHVQMHRIAFLRKRKLAHARKINVIALVFLHFPLFMIHKFQLLR